MPDSIQAERFEPRSVSKRISQVAQGLMHVSTVRGTAALHEIAGVITASRLERPQPAMVSIGVAEVDALTGGIPRGALTEIVGPASSGRTTCLLAAMGEATRRGEVCAIVDATDTFDPQSAAQAGVDLDCVLWVRCTGNACSGAVRASRQEGQQLNGTADGDSRGFSGREMKPWTGAWPRRPPARSERENDFGHRSTRMTAGGERAERSNRKSQGEMFSMCQQPRGGFREHWAGRLEQALKATDMLLQSGGFGLVVVDFGDIPADAARRVPLTSWFRFRRAVENTPTVLLVVEQEAFAKSCASLVLSLNGAPKHSTIRDRRSHDEFRGGDDSKCPAHTRLLDGITITAEVVRGERKPVRPARTEFESRTEWAG